MRTQTIKKNSTILEIPKYSMLFFLWIFFSFPLLKAEWLSLKQLPSLWNQSTLEKKFSTDGPVFLLAHMAQQVTPPESSVALITSDTGVAKQYDEGKLYFYLWPRKILIPEYQAIDKNPELEEVDFFLFFSSRNPTAWEQAFLGKMPFLKKKFEYHKNGHYMIYQNTKKKPQ